eukprot:5433760-Prymnesium_polylepis.1
MRTTPVLLAHPTFQLLCRTLTARGRLTARLPRPAARSRARTAAHQREAAIGGLLVLCGCPIWDLLCVPAPV